MPVAEVELAKDSLLAASTLLFESAEKTAGRFAEDEVLGRPHAYWSSYRERIQKVTAADVQRVARAYLEPENIVVLLVGRWSDLSSGESALRKVGERHAPSGKGSCDAGTNGRSGPENHPGAVDRHPEERQDDKEERQVQRPHLQAVETPYENACQEKEPGHDSETHADLPDYLGGFSTVCGQCSQEEETIPPRRR